MKVVFRPIFDVYVQSKLTVLVGYSKFTMLISPIRNDRKICCLQTIDEQEVYFSFKERYAFQYDRRLVCAAFIDCDGTLFKNGFCDVLTTD